jgi:hypothetical protein
MLVKLTTNHLLTSSPAAVPVVAQFAKVGDSSKGSSTTISGTIFADAYHLAEARGSSFANYILNVVPLCTTVDAQGSH